MRIISGQYRGKILQGKIPSNVRPTTDFAKESLFDILNSMVDFEDKLVLDLFSGAGAIGLEALSRGAGKVYFVDKSIESISLLKKNIDNLLIPKDKYNIIKSDVIDYLSYISIFEKFDIIFSDPPYNQSYLWTICEAVEKKSILNEDGIIVYETETKRSEIIHPSYEVIKEKVSGNAKFYFIQLKSE